MKDCCEKEGKHYIQIDTMFPNISEKSDHFDLQENQGIVSLFEVNLRRHPMVQAEILTQLYLGQIVTIQKQYDQWLYVEANGKKGWINDSSVEKSSVIKAKEQLQGETHRTIICEDCLNKLNWGQFYVDEIEPKQERHVINNLMLSYTEAAIALENGLDEDEEVPFDALKERILEEIFSGEHGYPLRFNEEEIIKYFEMKRA